MDHQHQENSYKAALDLDTLTGYTYIFLGSCSIGTENISDELKTFDENVASHNEYRLRVDLFTVSMFQNGEYVYKLDDVMFLSCLNEEETYESKYRFGITY